MTEDDDTDEPEVNAAVALAKSLHPLLASYQPEVIGAALADLASLLIAGHVADTPAATARLREKLLIEHVRAIRKLIPLQEAMMRKRVKGAIQ